MPVAQGFTLAPAMRRTEVLRYRNKSQCAGRLMMRRFVLRLLNAFRRDAADADFAREIAAHLALLEDDFRRRGMSVGEARLAATRALGSVAHTTDLRRDARTFVWVDDTRRDVRYALRTLGRNPTFAAVAMVTVALGIGASTSIFSVVNALLLTPLPYRDADRLVRIVNHVPAEESPTRRPFQNPSMNAEQFRWWREKTHTLSRMAAHQPTSMTLLAPDGAVQLDGARVSADLFTMLGARPVLGRALNPRDEQPDVNVVVLSSRLWQKYFGSDPSILQRTIMLDGKPYSVAGVMPADFEFPSGQAAFWMPFVVDPPASGVVELFGVLSQIKAGVSLAEADSEANTLGHQFLGEPPPAATGSPKRFEVVTMQTQLVAFVGPALRVLTAAVGVVLLIVCANVGNLLLARSIARQREIAVRRALGASRGRIIRQVLTESVVLSLAGGAAGIVLAYGGVQLVRTLATVDLPRVFVPAGGNLLPRLDEVAVNPAILTFAFGISVAAGLVFGLVPALHVSRVDNAHWLGSSVVLGSIGATPRTRSGMTTLLAVGQLVLATTLLVAAGLLVRSFVKLSNVNSGLDPENVLTFQFVLPQEYGGPRRLALTEDLISRLRVLPQVEAAGVTNSPPLRTVRLYFGSYVPPGFTPQDMAQDPLRPEARIVSADYLRAMGVRLLDGRWFDDSEANPAPVVIVNRTLAARYYGGKSPIGTLLRAGTGPGASTLEIIGVVDDVRQRGLEEEPRPMVFRHLSDTRPMLRDLASAPPPGGPPLSVRENAMLGSLSFAVRVKGDPTAIVSDVRAVARQLDRSAALDGFSTLEHLMSESIARPRFYAVLLAIFAGIAGMIAAVGIYGVLAYSVTQRTREIGIRMALGAQRGEVLALVLREGVVLTAIGVAIGLAGAAGVTRYLQGMLFGLTPLDPPTYVAVAVAFAAVATLASYMPARRATKVDPLMALRYE
jgi:putative ABC transport system permease protein